MSHHEPGPVLPSGSPADGTPIRMDELSPGNMVTPQKIKGLAQVTAYRWKFNPPSRGCQSGWNAAR